MKNRKITVFLSSTMMLLLSLFIYNNQLLQVTPASQYIINPYISIEEKPSPQTLLQIYGTIFNLVNSEDYNSAIEKLKELNLAYFPKSIRIIVDNFNRLLNESITKLENIKKYINNTNNALNIGNLTLAKELILNANVTLIEVNETIHQLSLLLDNFSSSTKLPLDKMSAYLAKMEDKVNKYFGIINQLYKKVNSYNELIAPTIIIKSSSSSAFVGEEIEIKGFIEVNGTPISNSLVSIFINNKNFTVIRTNNLGNFSLNYRIPYIYENTTKIFASYLPRGEEMNRYSPSISNILTLNILFYVPELIVSYPQTVYPTKSYYIGGIVSLNGSNLNNVEVQLSFYNLTLTNKTVDGSFSFNLEIPAEVKEGNYTLSILTSPNGKLGPASKHFTIQVIRFDPQIDLSYSNFIITGSSIVIQGIIKLNNTPLAGAKISVLNSIFSNYAISDNEGRFSLSIYTNVFYFSGNYEIQLKIEPNVGYSNDKIIIITVRTVNPFLVAIVLVFSSISFYLLYSIQRKRPKIITEKIEKEIPAREYVERISEKVYSGILRIYYSAVSFIEQITGIRLLPHHTIREYARLIENKIKYFHGFWKISILTERYLYREENIDRNALESAENEERKLMEENGKP